ncbi:MAG: TldD/PmbA family protein [Anaerolineales bacterium]
MNYLQTDALRPSVKEIVEKIAAQGTEGEAYIEEGTQSQVVVEGGKVEKLSRSSSKGLGVRAIRDGKVGYAYTSDFSPESLEAAWRGAVELAQIADSDECEGLPDPQPVPDEDLELYDPAIPELTMDEKVTFALAVEKATLEADPRVAMTNRCTYMDGIKTVYLANSRGFEGHYRQTFAASYIVAIGRQGDETTMAFGLGASTHLADLDPQAIGQEAAQKAVSLLGGLPIPSQEATVVLDPVVASELVGALAEALTAQAIQRGRSFLKGKMGQDVASDMITLLDNGRLPRGMGSAPFDGEGVPTQATRLLDEGVLQNVIYDTYTARKDGRQSTGNATRGSHRSAPTLAASNFYLQPGNQSPEEIIAGVEKGLYVLSTMNVGGINPVSGDYSVAARGLWIENGELTHPVNEVTIALPLDKLLKQIRAVGNDLRFVPFFGVIGSPTIRIDGMTIAGK